MRVVVLNLAHAADLAIPDAVLDEYRSLTGWAEGLVAAGAEVVVVQGFVDDARRTRADVEYDFVAGRFRPSLSRWRFPWRALRAVQARNPDVVHVNGLVYPLPIRALRALLPNRCPLIVQHHAERPARGVLAAVQRWCLGAADGFVFTGREMAEPWKRKGMVRPQQPVFEILEGSSSFGLAARATARASSGLTGEPLCIWLGNLDSNKDPLTVLDGFERLLESHPRARLCMAYRHDGLVGEVRERIARSRGLGGAVTLLGRLPYADLEVCLNSADLFLQGSHHEGSGYALVDAMACGVVPVVTDIPSFRFITGGVFPLWPPGDAEGLRAAAKSVLGQPLGPQRVAVRALFEERLSFEAIGRQALAAYRELARGRVGSGLRSPR